MTQTVSNHSPIKRIAHMAFVALCTVSSVILVGAAPSKDIAADRKPLAPASKPVMLASATLTHPKAIELLTPVDPGLPETRTDAPTETLAALIAAEAVPPTRILRMEVTAYCPCVKCCGPNAQGITASGKRVSYNGGKFVAADTHVLPFGQKLVIPGYADGQPVEVTDRGGAIKGNKLDLYFPTHQEALVWGRQFVDVTIYE